MVAADSRAGRAFLLALVALVAGGQPGQAAVPDADGPMAEEVARIEDYLNGLDTVQADFVQINPDGQTVTGEFYYDPPDRLRLDYDPPSRILIVANGGNVVYHDRALRQVNYLYTSQTPLAFLLEDEVRLSGDVTITALDRDDGELTVTVVRTDEPAEGAVTLAFAEQPLELRRWAVVDPQGSVTHVILENMKTDVELDSRLFRLRRPRN